ncbi:MAG: indolepyruvate ferredoxin oxidoreductase alpha subunit [Comamonadaceae bacterium]|nr:MAG: indolepyruvate ferredoxin oxidoreductase alpha subunit [Comamonadaceae bacterium]
MSEMILLGDEAIARGAIDAGISAAFAYPGTPSTEIYQAIEDYAKAHHLQVRGMWSTNEKVALEEGVGVSYAGRRSVVSMKHVGLNVAADPFMNAAVSGAHGGLVLVVADDPSMHSSQNEQDSRYFADFAMVPCLEPADQQQCYDFMREAFDLSEQFQVPVLVRLVTRLAHSRSKVKMHKRREQNEANFVVDPSRFILLPANARRAYASLVEKQKALQSYSEAHPVNALTLRDRKRPGILVSGLAWNYLQEAMGDALEDYNLLRIGCYPLPVQKIRQLLDASSDIYVIEEGYPFIERYITALGLMRELPIHGKLTGDLPRTGELSQDAIKHCFGIAIKPSLQIPGLADVLVGRPPSLCDKCPHTDSYLAINEVIAEYEPGARIMGDIGCYTLGAVGPLHGIHSCLCMGASIGMAIGVVHAGMPRALCVIGDGTFTHSGLAPMLDAARDNTNIKVFILDNSIIAMTGGQPTAASDEDVVALVAGLGVPRDHIRVVVPSPHKKAHTMETIREELDYVGLSVIIARRACVTYAKEIKDIKSMREEKRQSNGVPA